LELKFVTPHISIKNFNTVQLPDLTIITGLNGAGKTHLLKAIDEGHATIDSVPHANIKYYDSASFRVTVQQSLTSAEIIQQQNSAWQFLNTGSNKIKPRQTASSYFDQSFKAQTQVRDENGAVVETQNVNFWEEATDDEKFIWVDDEYRDSGDKISTHRQDYRQKLKTGLFNNQHFRAFQYHQNIIKALKALNKPVHLVGEKEFKEAFAPTNKNDNPLALSVSTIFTKYKISQYEWIHEQMDRLQDNAPKYSDLKSEFEQRYQKPWTVINKIIADIHAAGGSNNVFDFSITDPDNDIITITNFPTYRFNPQLKDNSSGDPRDFGALSSGEQVLLALTLSIYEAQDNFEFPDVILLDEVDASLHPSMTDALLETLNAAFISQGVKVILATHSPSTIAICDEASIFVLEKREKSHALTKQPKKKALEILSQGYATLETGIAIFNEVANAEITIITEGKNSTLIQKACDLYGYNDVKVVSCFQGKSGKDQLNTMFQFFKQAKHENPVLFVWDTDVNGQKQDEDNTYGLILPKNKQNTIYPKGIENLFEEKVFSGFTKKGVDSYGNSFEVFDERRKNDFNAHVLQNGTKEDFAVFQPLFDYLDKIRSEGKNQALAS